jgi:hypothetical protein
VTAGQGGGDEAGSGGGVHPPGLGQRTGQGLIIEHRLPRLRAVRVGPGLDGAVGVEQKQVSGEEAKTGVGQVHCIAVAE